MLLKRLLVWFAEIVCQVVLLTLVFPPILDFFEEGPGRYSTATVVTDLKDVAFVVAFFMIISGYLITTAVVGVLFRPASIWKYALIIAALFVAHTEVFVIAGGRARGGILLDQFTLQAVGAFAVFACASAGSQFLRKWQ